MLRAQGDLVAALTSYRDSLAIFKTLVAKDPGNTDWRASRLATTTSVRSCRHRAIAGALASHSNSSDRREPDAKDPGNTDWQRDIALGDDDSRPRKQHGRRAISPARSPITGNNLAILAKR